ncbi:ATP-binding protein [Lentzea sp. E54]|uniref:ATP-binding protein n=1 Tax=Lentzea xerophila TaxID=3435883 RepID=UPI003DA4AD6E
MTSHANQPQTSANAPGLVGREAELDRVRHLLELASKGKPAFVLFEGALGIGRTAMLDAVAEMAESLGFQVGKASASKAERQIPYGVAQQLFEGAFADFSERTTEDHPSVVSPLTYEPVARAAVDPLDARGEMEDHRVFQRLLRLIVAAASRRPLCLILDDLQCADLPTVRWLNYLARRRPTRLPLVVVISRMSGAQPEDPILVAELEMHADRVRLAEFTPETIESHVKNLLGEAPTAEFVEACKRATGGNPFVLSELLRSMLHKSAAPETATASNLQEFTLEGLGKCVLARLNRQSARLVQLAKTIAVLEPCALDLAASVGGMSVPEVADDVLQLINMGLLNADSDNPAFEHVLVQKAVTSAVGHEERDQMHARAVRYLREMQAPDALMAKHIQQTTESLGVWAALVLQKAAESAIAAGDPAIAAGLLSRALHEDIPTALRNDLLAKLGITKDYSDPLQALAHLDRVSGDPGDPDAFTQVACRRAQLLYIDNRYDEANEVLSKAIAEMDSANPRIAHHLRLALRVTAPAPVPAEVEVEPEDLDAVQEEGGAHASKHASLIAQVAMIRGKYLDLSRRAALVALSGGVGQTIDDPGCIVATIDALRCADEFDLALRYCNETMAEADRLGLGLMSPLSRAMRSQINRQRGLIVEAVSDARIAVAACQDSYTRPQHCLVVFTTEVLIRALIDRGDLREARDLFEPIGLVSPLPRSWQHTFLLHTRGILRLQLGDVDGALTDQLECGARLSSWGVSNPAFLPWRSYAALAQLRLGRRQEALDLVLEELELARRWTSPSSIARALLSVGLVTGGPAAIPWLQEAEEILRNSPARSLRCQVLVELGAARWKHGHREAARENLLEAKLLGEQCGAMPALAALAKLPEEAVGQSKSFGILPAATALPLTPREFRVAELVAAGNSNDEVAVKLSVSRRAVEFHLTNIYRKLGVRRRTQLSSTLFKNATGC